MYNLDGGKKESDNILNETSCDHIMDSSDREIQPYNELVPIKVTVGGITRFLKFTQNLKALDLICVSTEEYKLIVTKLDAPKKAYSSIKLKYGETVKRSIAVADKAYLPILVEYDPLSSGSSTLKLSVPSGFENVNKEPSTEEFLN